jgi:DNA polymerase-3 subunit gamma/tau
VDAFAARDGAAVFDTVNRVVEAGHDPRRFASDLLDRLRDLIVLQRAPDAAERELVDVPPDELPRLQQQATHFGPAELSRAADLVYAGLTEMRGTTSPKLVLELICARVLLPGAAADEAGTLARLDRLERRLSIAGTPEQDGAARPAPPAAVSRPEPAAGRTEPAQAPAPAAAPASREPAAVAASPGGSPGTSGVASQAVQDPGPAASPEPAASPSPVAPVAEAPVAPPLDAGTTAVAAAAQAPSGELDAAAVRRVWPDVLDAVSRRKRTTRALLDAAQVTGLAGRELSITFQHGPLARQFDRGPNAEVLHDALAEVLGVDWQVKAEFGDAAGTAAAPPPAAPAAAWDASPAPSAPPAAQAPPAPPPPPYDEDEVAPDDEAVPAPVTPAGEDPAMALLRSGLGAQVISRSEQD